MVLDDNYNNNYNHDYNHNQNQLKSEKDEKEEKKNNTEQFRPNIHTSRDDVNGVGENESLNTAKILSITELNPVTTYTKSSLDNIARILCIPTTYINNDKRTTYKKDELYRKIEEHLKNKNN